jgi:hypothetical protein
MCRNALRSRLAMSNPGISLCNSTALSFALVTDSTDIAGPFLPGCRKQPDLGGSSENGNARYSSLAARDHAIGGMSFDRE